MNKLKIFILLAILLTLLFGIASPASRPVSRPVVVARPPSRPVVVVARPPSRPVVVVARPPSRPVVVVGRPPPRPVVIVAKPPPRPVIVIRTRRVTRISIRPVIHPLPVYNIVLYPNQQVFALSSGACTNKATGESISNFCQAQVARSYDPSSLITTKQTCCATYAEASCYVRNAGAFCSQSDAASLIKNNQDIANYFSNTICRSVPFGNWESACASNAVVAQNGPFIQLPPPVGNGQVCITKLGTSPGGNIADQCLNASLSVWDPNRSKLADSQIGESCCAMYDLLDCVYGQALDTKTCTGQELADLDNYRKVSANAFTGGVCRALPYDQANKMCRGRSYAVGPSFGLMLSSMIAIVFVWIKIK